MLVAYIECRDVRVQFCSDFFHILKCVFLDKGSICIQYQKEFPTVMLLVSFKFLIKPSNVKKLLFSQLCNFL
jgi:hypothetical protein